MMSKWKHATYSLCILILIVYSIYFLLIQPALETRKKNIDSFESLAFQLKKYNNIKQKTDSLDIQIRRLKESNPNNLDFIKNKPRALITADLQKLLKSLIETNEGSLISIHADPKANVKEENFSNITVKIHMRGNIEALRTILYKLAVNKPLLFTDNIMVRKNMNNSRRQSERNKDQLEIRFDVTGYIEQTSS